MGHYCTVYGYIQIHHTHFDEVSKHIKKLKDEGNLAAKFILGHYDYKRSGFITFGIGGEFKEYHYVDPDEFIGNFSIFLKPIKGICCTICFDSELSIYPKRVDFAKLESDWFKVEN